MSTVETSPVPSALPAWGVRHEVPALPRVAHELKLPCGESVHVKETYMDSAWYASLCVGAYIEGETMEAARSAAVGMVIDRMERALADLRFYRQGGKPQPGSDQQAVEALVTAAIAFGEVDAELDGASDQDTDENMALCNRHEAAWSALCRAARRISGKEVAAK